MPDTVETLVGFRLPSEGLLMTQPAVRAPTKPCPCSTVLTMCSFLISTENRPSARFSLQVGGVREVDQDGAEDAGLAAVDVEHVDGAGL